MKTMKRFSAILIAVFLMVSMMVIPASAAGDCSITITHTNKYHTYNVYQIFTGVLQDSILTEIEWGSSVTETAQSAMGNARTKAGALTTEAHARAFAEELVRNRYLGTAVASGSPTDTTYTVTGLDAGYYLVTDTVMSVDGEGNPVTGEATSQYIVQVLGKVSMQPKSGIPSISKQVSRNAINYYEGTSVSIGDTVYYKVTISLHDYVNNYANYYLRLEDTIPDGITYDNSTDFIGVKVENGATNATVSNTYYTVNYANNKLTVTIPDIHDAIKAATTFETKVADKLVVYYKAKLNSSADVGVLGEENVAKLYYSNDPNETYDGGTTAPIGLGVTKDDVATVYSYKLALKKVDSTNSDTILEGATFVLYVKVDGTETKKYMTFDTTGLLTGYVNSESEATKLTTDINGLLQVSGLGRGTYWLHEVTAPSGYNLNETDVSVSFEGALDGNTGKLSSISANQSGGTGVEVDNSTALITVTVPNHKGATLPTTGGIGTTIFYGIGGVLVIGALSLLIVRKRTTAK